MQRLRSLLLFLAASILAASPALATWSIVAVNTRTGEVMVGIASCVEDENLRKCCPIIIPEVGVACAQKFTAPDEFQVYILDMMQVGMDPERILEDLAVMDAGHDQRQYGLADLAGRSATWTGDFPGDWQGGAAGADGEIVYAIQGNVLTGQPVIDEAEDAFLNTPGDMAEKLMAAMEAAAAMGGDGRCSCTPGDPTGCGSPPPDFEKSAHNGGMFIARPGDDIGDGNANQGYANGDYWLWINIAGRGSGAEDPVVLMRQDYDAWRADLGGRPDAVLSERSISHESVAASSPETVTIELDLKDVEGDDVVQGGAAISLQHENRSAGMSALQSVTDQDDGSYTVEILSGDAPGVDRFRLIIDDGVRPVHLWPPFELRHAAAEPVPYNGGDPIEGLPDDGFLGPAQLLGDGLVAYFLEGRDAEGLRLFRAERPDPDSPFGAAEEVVLFGQERVTLADFWISEDELRLTLSGARGVGPGQGVEKLFRTSRADPDDPFPEPERIEELDSALGDGGPWLSEDELELWFHSKRDGTWRIWRSLRLADDAFWHPPIAVEGLAEQAGSLQRAPLLAEGGTRLWFAEGEAGAGGTRVHRAEATGPGNELFTAGAPLTGSTRAPGSWEPAWRSADGAETWLHGRHLAGGLGVLNAASRTANALDVQGSPVSAAAGGRLDFTLEAGPDFAGASFLILGSGSTAAGGWSLRGLELPLERDPFSTLLLADPLVLDGNLNGRLDALGQGAASLELEAGTPVPGIWLDRVYRFSFVASNGAEAFVSNAVEAELVP